MRSAGAKSSPVDGGVILVTGASAGIGRAIAQLVATRADGLALVARRRARLDALRTELASGRARVETFDCDLASAEARERMIDGVLATFGRVDVLVNNAGFGLQGRYEAAPWSRIHEMLSTNTAAPMYLVHRLLPGMIERRAGGILNVGSGAGVAPVAGAAAYTATKFLLHGFTEALRLELAGTGVRATEVCPGPVATEFDAVSGIVGGMAGGPPQAIRISADECARAALEGFDRDRPVTYPGRGYHALMRVRAILPAAAQRRLGEGAGRAVRHSARHA